jgi:translation initiation factor 2 gamma subunit (eIF-2gamma)
MKTIFNFVDKEEIKDKILLISAKEPITQDQLKQLESLRDELSLHKVVIFDQLRIQIIDRGMYSASSLDEIKNYFKGII